MGGIPFPLRSENARSGLGFERADFMLLAPRELFALRPARSATPEVRADERVVELPLAVLVRPVVRPDVGLHDELVSLAGILGDRLSETLECREPDARGHF